MDNPLNFKISDLNSLPPSQGRVLIAEPFMMDPYFKRSVVILTEHDEEKGTMGFILNKPMDLELNDALIEFPDFEIEVFMGGPVEPDKLFFLHTMGDVIADSVEIVPGLYWGGNFEALKTLVKNEQVSKDEIRFFIGYSGWDAEQLASEMKEESWLVSEVDINAVMCRDCSKMWADFLKNMGKKQSMLANFPEDPALN